VRSFVDDQLGAACSFGMLSDGNDYCVPSAHGSLSLSDETCSAYLVSGKPDCTGSGPRFATARSTASCLAPKYLEAVEPYSGTLYSRSTCMPAEGAAVDGVIASVAEIADDERFARVDTHVLESDPGRLKPVYRTREDGSCLFDKWHDAELDTLCAFMETEDGAQRCVPEPTQSAVLEAYPDEQCATTPSYYFASCAEAAMPKFVSSVVRNTCTGSIVRVHATLASVAAESLPQLWIASGSDCLEYRPQAEYALYELGAPMAPEAFMAGEEPAP
jgi:hypothetical protein